MPKKYVRISSADENWKKLTSNILSFTSLLLKWNKINGRLEQKPKHFI